MVVSTIYAPVWDSFIPLFSDNCFFALDDKWFLPGEILQVSILMPCWFMLFYLRSYILLLLLKYSWNLELFASTAPNCASHSTIILYTHKIKTGKKGVVKVISSWLLSLLDAAVTTVKPMGATRFVGLRSPQSFWFT